MIIQPATLKRADEHYFKLNFPGNSALLEKPLSLLEVEEAKENMPPTFSPADCRPSSPCPLLWWVDELWWSMFNSEVLTNCLPRWMERNIITLYTLSICNVRSCVLGGFVYVADGFAKQNSCSPLWWGRVPSPNSGYQEKHWMDNTRNWGWPLPAVGSAQTMMTTYRCMQPMCGPSERSSETTSPIRLSPDQAW